MLRFSKENIYMVQLKGNLILACAFEVTSVFHAGNQKCTQQKVTVTGMPLAPFTLLGV